MIQILNENFRNIVEGMSASLKNFNGGSDSIIDSASVLHRLYDDLDESFTNIGNFRVSDNKLLFKLNRKNFCVKYNEGNATLIVNVEGGEMFEVFDNSHEYDAYLWKLVEILKAFA